APTAAQPPVRLVSRAPRGRRKRRGVHAGLGLGDPLLDVPRQVLERDVAFRAKAAEDQLVRLELLAKPCHLLVHERPVPAERLGCTLTRAGDAVPRRWWNDPVTPRPGTAGNQCCGPGITAALPPDAPPGSHYVLPSAADP